MVPSWNLPATRPTCCELLATLLRPSQGTITRYWSTRSPAGEDIDIREALQHSGCYGSLSQVRYWSYGQKVSSIASCGTELKVRVLDPIRVFTSLLRYWSVYPHPEDKRTALWL